MMDERAQLEVFIQPDGVPWVNVMRVFCVQCGCEHYIERLGQTTFCQCGVDVTWRLLNMAGGSSANSK